MLCCPVDLPLKYQHLNTTVILKEERKSQQTKQTEREAESMICSTLASPKCSLQDHQGGVPKNLKFLTRRNAEFQGSKNYSTPLAMSHSERVVDKPFYNQERPSNIIRSYSTTADHEHNNGQVPEIKNYSGSLTTSLSQKLDIFIRFCRPYSPIGTIVAIISTSLLPIQSMADLSPTFFIGMLKALISLTLMTFYTVAINQLCDIKIDKINKPDLPLASGELSTTVAIAMTALSSIMAIAMGFMFKSPPLLYGIFTYFLLGTAYSVHLPFLRWKNSTVLSEAVIGGVRAYVFPICVFLHIQKYVLGRTAVLTKPVLFAVAFMTIMTTAITIMKDIPDIEGDKAFGKKSLPMKIGQEKVFWLGISLLMMAYVMAIVVGLSLVSLPNRIITVLGHSIIALHLWFRTQRVVITQNSSTIAFYIYIWKLLYIEYLLIPFVR